MPGRVLTAGLFACLFLYVVTSADARAELGGTMPPESGSSMPASRALLNGALRVRTFTDAGQTTINEYATNSGQIVAYTWQGPTMPDLRGLLGRHADSYHAGAVPATGGNLHASRVARPDVVVESGGPMRGYVGRAWLPAALPAGVSADDLR
ncbi:DUF2844 domain-containing protein [Paraburkholderia sp. GAS199]|uniref:DUF2844 domain-containing protein n=1 Tax=Paraburkholderia sp. GAS199 TaxID=3035126 RepID=UPI003D1A576A